MKMIFLEDYIVLTECGSGSFAKVFKVRHKDFRYIRAVKVLDKTIVDENSEDYKKFIKECQVLLRLGNGNHPNIVHIYRPALREQKAFVEMDYIEGADLNTFLDKHNNYLPFEDVLRLAREIASALSYCHYDIFKYCIDPEEDNIEVYPHDGSKFSINELKERELVNKYKVIHNDLHSGNIMRRKDGSFVLLDFGLSIEGKKDNTPSSRRTNGAPEYKAPEKWEKSNSISEATDIYSFGVILYKVLAGIAPFPYDESLPQHIAESNVYNGHMKKSPSSIETIRKAAYEKIHGKDSYKKDYPDWFEDIIMKCLNKEPKDRYANGKKLHCFLENEVSNMAQSVNHKEDLSKGIDAYREENSKLSEINACLKETLDKLENEKVVLMNKIKELEAATSATPYYICEENHKKEMHALECEIKKLTSRIEVSQQEIMCLKIALRRKM